MYTSTLLMTLAGLSTLIEATPLKPRGGGKRGLAFPKECDGTAGSAYTKSFSSASKVNWMYDWEAVIDGTPLDLEYVPMLHDNSAVFTEGWTANVAAAQKKYTVSHVLAFNEPDQVGGGGTDMSVSDAVAAYKEYVQPLAAQGLRLGSPAVTNGGGANMGIGYLKQFIAGCSGCQIDFVATHYYAPYSVEDFQNYLTTFHQTFNKPVWVTEFGVTSGDADTFLAAVLPWMDAQDWIERYAYQMVAPSTGSDQFLMNAAGTGLSSTGQVYAST